MKLIFSPLLICVIVVTFSCNFSQGGIYNIEFFKEFLGKEYSYCESSLLKRGFNFNTTRTPDELRDFEAASFVTPFDDYIEIFFDQKSPSLARRIFLRVAQEEESLMLIKSLEDNGYQVIKQGKSRNTKVSLNLYQNGTNSIVFATYTDSNGKETYGFDFCSEQVFERVYKSVF